MKNDTTGKDLNPTGESQPAESSQAAGEAQAPEGAQTAGEAQAPEGTQAAGEAQAPEGTQALGEVQAPEDTQALGEVQASESSRAAGSPNTEGGQQEPAHEKLFLTYSHVFDWDTYRQMDQDLIISKLKWSSVTLMSILVVAGSLLLFIKPVFLGIIVIVLGALLPGSSIFVHKKNLRRQYDSAKTAKDQERRFVFFKDYFILDTESSHAKYRYEDLYEIVETKDRFYLSLEKNHYLPVKKENDELAAFLHSLGKQPQEQPLVKPMLVVLWIVLFAGAGLVAITALEPEEDQVRGWVMACVYPLILLAQACIVLRGITWNLYSIHNIQKKGKRIFLRTLSILACLAVILGLFVYSVILTFGTTLGTGSFSKNPNGTYTEKTDEYVGGAAYSLWEGDGPFYFRYLRPMADPQDTDPSISLEEWKELHDTDSGDALSDVAGNGKENQGVPDGANGQGGSGSNENGAGSLEGQGATSGSDNQDGTSAGTEDQNGASSGSDEVGQDMAKISDGYQKLYDTYFSADGDSFTESYDAKGNTYYILKEDSSSILYLKYDRDSSNGSCGLYVLLQADKGSDGSWSNQGAQIVDMYAYEYSTGQTADSGKKDWSDAGSQEYQDLTGEP